jgi:hypothetical protein
VSALMKALAKEPLEETNLGDETPIDILPEFRLVGSRVCQATIFTNKHTQTGQYVIGANIDEFIAWLEDLSGRIVTYKEANQLISPAIFDPNHLNRPRKRRRGLENIGTSEISGWTLRMEI